MQSLAFEHGRHLVIVVTKIDKLNQAEKSANLKRIAQAYRLEISDLALAGEGLGTEAVWSRLWDLV